MRSPDHSIAPTWRAILSLIGFCVLILVGCSEPEEQQPVQSKDFDMRYEEVYMRIIATDINEAQRIADSLVMVALTDEQKAKSLMLLGHIHQSLGDLPAAINHVLEIQRIANRSKLVDWQSRSSGFLASTFRAVGLLDESKKHLVQAETANEKQKDDERYLVTKVNILQEWAFHAMEDSLFNDMLDYLRQAEHYLTKEENGGNMRMLLSRATNDQLKAVAHLHLGQLEEADSLLHLSLQKLGDEESNLRPYIYRAQAESALKKGQYDSTYHFLQLAEPYIDTSQREELKRLLYSTFIRYYQAIGNHEQAVNYNELYQTAIRERERYARQISNELVRMLNAEKQHYEESVRSGWALFFGVVVLMGGVLAYVLVRRNAERKKYQKLIQDLENGQHVPVGKGDQVMDIAVDTKEDHNQDKEIAISTDTERKLLSKLEELEETAFFLDKDISLNSLSSYLNTNQRYVSFIIRKYRNMDFNSYIQHYRIHYIINRIKLEPDLLDYKLSYLADLAGFSSHSKFSTVFKSVTGIPPSVFLHYTKDELGK